MAARKALLPGSGVPHGGRLTSPTHRSPDSMEAPSQAWHLRQCLMSSLLFESNEGAGALSGSPGDGTPCFHPLGN